MAALTIKDLSANHTLDRTAMSSIRGGGAEWVFGWMQPYVAASSRRGASTINFYEINNYFADQIINQVQKIDIANTGANANINLAVDERSTNIRH